MSQLIYVPVIVHGRDKYEYHAISCGCFLTKENAINAIVDKLVENDFLPFDTFIDMLSDRFSNIKEAEILGEEIEPDYIFDNLTEDVTIEQFIQRLKQKVNGDVNILEDICKHFGDSYYKDGWKFQIDEHSSKLFV